MKQRETEYSAFRKRVRKTTYQSKNLKFDRPSLAMTELAVDYLRDIAPRELGRIDMYWASSMCQESYVSPCTLMVALMYARRLKLNNTKYLETVQSSNLLLVSMMVASKFLVEVDDTTLEEWMKASNMDSHDLYELEMDFLKAIDWNLFVSVDDFWLFLFQLEQRIAWRQFQARNEEFFTYTDLHVLSQSHDGTIWNSFVKMCLDIFKVTVACTATYAVVVFILASIPHLDKTTLVTDIKKMVVLNPTLPQAPESSSLYFENHMFGMDDSLDRDDLVDQAYGYLMMNNSEGCCAKCDEQMCPGRSPNNTSGVTKNHSSIHDPLSQIMGLFSVPYPSSFFQLTFPEPQSLS